MKKRVLVLGSMGMLGQEVLTKLLNCSTIQATGTYNSKVPLEKTFYKKFEANAMGTYLPELLKGADYVINCAAVLKSDIDEKNPASVKKAHDVNGVFPRLLAEAAAKSGTNVIHISTDGVFSGNTESPLSELTEPLPNDVYGKSKLEGEIKAPNFLTIRTSIIGRDPVYKRGLMEWFLKLPHGFEIPGFGDIWHGVTNKQLAHLIAQIIEKDCFAQIVEESSLHHFCPNQPLTKAELLAIFKKMFNKDVSIKPMERPDGIVNRTLTTCYKTLSACYDGKKDIESAILDLR